MISILATSAVDMPGCLSYVIAGDSIDEDVLWVTELWESAASHDASLSLPAVRKVVPRGKLIVSQFDKIAVTRSAWATPKRVLG
jgi:quinol monooxygenase YgiN